MNVAAKADDDKGYRLARRFRVRAGVGDEVRHYLLHEQLVDQHRQETARVLAKVLREVLGDHGCDGKAALDLHPGGGQSR